MALAYLLDPCLQHQNRAGVNNVSGWFEVFEYDTDDRATVYTDFAGTLAPAHIGIDNNGRAVMIVDSAIAYRVEMHAPNGELIYTQAPVWTVASGGGVCNAVKVVSTDGTVDVAKTTVGAVTTYDLSVEGENEPSTWGSKTCSASAINVTGDWVEVPYASSEGSISYNNGWTATKKCAVDIAASLEMDSGDSDALNNFDVKCEFFKNGTSVLVENGQLDPSKSIDRVCFEYKGAANASDVIDAKIYVRSAESLTVDLVGRVFYNEECDGLIGGGGGGGTTYTAGEGIDITGDVISVDQSVIQHKLVAGDNVTINNVTNTISVDLSGKADKVDGATNGNLAGLDSNGNLTDSGIAASDVATQSDLSGKQDTLTTGPNVDIINNVISTEKTVVAAGQNVSVTSSLDSLTRTVTYTVSSSGGTFEQVQSDWTEDDTEDPAYIKHRPTQKTIAAGDGILISENASNVTITANPTNADWTENDPTDAGYIKHRPTTSNLYAGSGITISESGGYTVIAAQNPSDRIQSDWDQSNPSAPSYIQNRPTEKTLVAGNGISITETASSVTIEATAPSTGNVPTVTSSDDGKLLQASYDSLTGVGSYAWETVNIPSVGTVVV